LLHDRSEPDPFLDTFTGLVAARAVTTAVMLGVFEALHETPATSQELSERLSLDPLGAETLLVALATLGYVDLDGAARAANTATTRPAASRSSPC